MTPYTISLGVLATSLTVFANAATLTATVTTDKHSYSNADPIRITITLTNTGSAEAYLPQIDNTAFGLYASITIQQVSSGIIAFTFDDAGDSVTSRAASTTQVLQPGASITLMHTINLGGAGLFGYSNSANPETLTNLYGAFSLSASLTINADNRPTGGDPRVFVGTIAGPPTTVVIIQKELGDVNADGVVDCLDVAVVIASFGKKCGQHGFDPRADVTDDCVVDIRDLSLVSQRLRTGLRCGQ